MVVQNDHVAGGGGQRLMAERAAIDADDQIGLGRQRLNRRDVRAIALVDAVGDIQHRLDALTAQPVDQQCGRGAAVYVVIGKDGDALRTGDGAQDARGRLVHVTQAQGIWQKIAQARLQIGLCLMCGEAAFGQNAADGQRQAAFLRQGLGRAFQRRIGAAPGPAGQRVVDGKKGGGGKQGHAGFIPHDRRLRKVPPAYLTGLR